MFLISTSNKKTITFKQYVPPPVQPDAQGNILGQSPEVIQQRFWRYDAQKQQVLNKKGKPLLFPNSKLPEGSKLKMPFLFLGIALAIVCIVEDFIIPQTEAVPEYRTQFYYASLIASFNLVIYLLWTLKSGPRQTIDEFGGLKLRPYVLILFLGNLGILVVNMILENPVDSINCATNFMDRPECLGKGLWFATLMHALCFLSLATILLVIAIIGSSMPWTRLGAKKGASQEQIRAFTETGRKSLPKKTAIRARPTLSPAEQMQKLQALFSITTRVKMEDVAQITGLTRDGLMEILVQNAHTLKGIKIDGDFIVVADTEDLGSFLQVLDQQFNDWGKSEAKKADKV